MTFLNMMLLGGAATFAIPLIIHLLNRSKFKSMDWGAMIFLEEIRKVNTRRFRWQTWLLLLLRCAIPILLAICMARPWMTLTEGMTNWVQGGSQSASIIIDDTLSMSAPMMNAATSSTESNSFTKAASITKAIVDSSSESSSLFSIIPISGLFTPSQSTQTRDKSKIVEVIDTMQPVAGTAKFIDSIDRAIDEVSKSRETLRSIVLVSDFQRSMIDKLDDASLSAVAKRLESVQPPIQLVLLPTEKTPSGFSANQTVAPENISIHVDPITRSIAGLNQPWEVLVRLKNHGASGVNNASMTLLVDDKPMLSRRIDLPAGTESQLNTAFAFDEIGIHRVQARIDTDEKIQVDNIADWSVVVLGSIPVLIVDDRLTGDQNPNSDFLQVALSLNGDPQVSSIDSSLTNKDLSKSEPYVRISYALHREKRRHSPNGRWSSWLTPHD